MKKITGIILSIIMLFALVTPAFAQVNPHEDLNILVATDLHYTPKPTEYTKRFEDKPLYGNVAPTGKMYDESSVLIDTFLQQAADSEAQNILIAGDLCDEAFRKDHVVMSEKLRNFENASGKKVYVINGNHDCKEAPLFTVSDFKEMYREFGYDEAILIDENSGSYVADLNSTYRLIAADTNSTATYQDGSNSALIEWITAQAQKAVADGKYPILLQHHSIMQHYDVQALLTGGYILENTSTVCSKLAKSGIRYAFTGHIHIHDIAKTATPYGNIYDIAGGCLTAAPVAYRQAVFTEESVTTETLYIDAVDSTKLAAGYPEEQLELMVTDFRKYASGALSAGMEFQIKNYVNVQKLAELLKVSPGNPIYKLLENVIPTASLYLEAPLYRDRAENGVCVENLTDKYGLKLPQSGYGNWYELLSVFLSALIEGKSNIPYDSPEVRIFLNSTQAILAEALRGISGTQARQLYVKISEATGVRAVPSVFTALNLLCSDYGFVPTSLSGVLTPLLETVIFDTTPNDLWGTLEPYGFEEEMPTNIFAIIISYFSKLFEKFKSLFRAVC